HGKGFDQFVERARYQFGGKFRRSMISQLYLNPSNQNLIIETFDTEINQKTQHEVELVVLSSGIRPKEDFIQLSKRMGLVLDRYGFVGSHEFEPISTNREGIYVCGMARGPKCIPDTVIESSAAALEVSWFLKEERGKIIKELKGPEEKEIAPEPRIGVFICHCGSNIAGVLDIEELVDFTKGLDGVVVAKNFMFTCATDTQEVLKGLIEEHRLNRVVVAACSPRTHEPLFRATLKRAGLNPYLFEMANIRDQCSWVHGSSPQEALRKAKRLIRGAVFKASLLEPLEEHKFRVSKEALVVGGGVSGLVAALSLADQGFGVHLVEITDQLGGIAKGIVETLKGHSPLNYAKMLSRQVLGHPNIKVYLNSRLVEHRGHVGSFEGVILSKDKRFSVKYGAVIVATGGIPYQPTEYLYGEDNRVLTQFELQDLLRKEPDMVKGINSVLMIQCVGSRNEEFPQCSRVCCGTAVKNALRLKDIKPSLQVIVLYRDLRTYGSNELYYLKARKAGVLFFRYIQENPPRVETEGDSLVVTFLDRGSRERFLVRPDMVVLSAGVRPNPHSQELSEVLKLPKNQVGLFQEAHIKLRPVEFSTPGIFLAGMAHSPR
ncbi:MAG: FAD-dependent oxidoreductase, partial [Desulfatiglandales bacterium]